VGGTFTFKQIFYAKGCGGAFESLVGTMIAAKKQVLPPLPLSFISHFSLLSGPRLTIPQCLAYRESSRTIPQWEICCCKERTMTS
jgi:hypothetical protein